MKPNYRGGLTLDRQRRNCRGLWEHASNDVEPVLVVKYDVASAGLGMLF
jgi:hypothetical protein